MTFLFNVLKSQTCLEVCTILEYKVLIENVIYALGKRLKAACLNGILVAVSTLSMQILNPKYHFSLNETRAPWRSD